MRAARQALLRPSLSAGWSLTEHAALTRQFLGRVGDVRFKGVACVPFHKFRADVFWEEVVGTRKNRSRKQELKEMDDVHIIKQIVLRGFLFSFCTFSFRRKIRCS